MIKTIIIEDEFFAADELKDLVSKLGFWVVGVYHSGERFVAETNWDFDIAIVDIFLSRKMTGLDVAQVLVERQKDFIFLTANKDIKTLKAAARYNPKAYISKPWKPNDVVAALEIISNQLAPKVELRSAQGVSTVNPSDIYFIKSDDVYIELHTTKGVLVHRKLLKEIAEELPDQFIRVHRSYIVNSSYIDRRSATEVLVQGKSIPVSRKYKSNVI